MDRVLEIGGYAAGYAGRLFVREGCEVVRIDEPRSPAWASDRAMSLYLDEGKRRLPRADVDLLDRLANAADIVICEATTASALSALGFDKWQTAVKVGITPFGRTGPKRDWAATPSTLLALGGYTALMGDPDGAPLTLPGHYLEFQTGALAFAAANSARFADWTGAEGEFYIGMFETLMSMSQFTSVRWHCVGEVRGRHGSDFWYVAPSDLYRCADGWVYVNIVPQFWDPFVVLLDRPELMLEERWAGNDGRMADREEIGAIIAETFLPLTRAQIEQRAAECRVPVGVVRTLEEVLAEPHLRERDAFERIEAEDRSILSPRVPYRIHEADA